MTKANLTKRYISVFIPGIIYIPYGFLETVRPTFSRQITESGFPLWGEADITIHSMFPASQEMFDDLEK